MRVWFIQALDGIKSNITNHYNARARFSSALKVGRDLARHLRKSTVTTL